jgi:hypothetical protein
VFEAVLRMPFTFSNAKYTDMVYACGFCNGSAVAVVAECHQWFPNHSIPDRRVFIRVFNTLRESGMLCSAHVSSQHQVQQHAAEVENILQLVQCSPGTSSQRISMCLGVQQTRIWKTLHDAGLYPYHIRCVYNT